MRIERPTEHPHVVIIDRAAGPCAVMKGTRLAIWWLVRQLRAGDTPEDVHEQWPYVSLAMIHSGLSYYHDHRDEIDPIIEEGDRLAAEHSEMSEQGRVIYNDLP